MIKINKTISIIIPHYNSPNKLQRLLETLPLKYSIQVIVVDDNSNKYLDDYYKLVDKYPEVEFYQSNTNGGAGKARNIGLKKAEGDWVLFADADDYFITDQFERALDKLDFNYDIVFFRPTSIFEDTKQEANRHKSYSELIFNFLHDSKKVNELKLRTKFHPPWSKFYKKEFIASNELQFDEIQFANDINFSLKAGIKAKGIKAETIAFYVVTKDHGTLTTTKNPKNLPTRLKAAINHYKFANETLNRKELRQLDLPGINLLFRHLLIYKSLRKLIKFYSRLKAYRIVMLNLNFINPIYYFRKLYKSYKSRNERNKYIYGQNK